MTDPVYMFSKTEGWIPEPQRMVTMKCGKRVKLEFRRPEIDYGFIVAVPV